MMGEDPQAQDPLGAALLPVLLHRLNNSTQFLATLDALFKVAGGTELAIERMGDLASTSREVDELGFLLAVLASGSGADLLLERREARGLALMAQLVADGMKRSKRPFECPFEDLPGLAPGALAGWELPWAVGALLWASADGLEEGEALVRRVERPSGDLALSAPCGRAVQALASQVRERLPGAALDVSGSTWRLSAPAAWFAESA